MSPWGHALAMLVPIYALDRAYAHFDAIRYLALEDGESPISPGWLVTVIFLSNVALIASEFVQRDLAVATKALALLASTWPLVVAQGALDRHTAHRHLSDKSEAAAGTPN